MAEPKGGSPPIQPHPLVEALVSDPAKPPERTIKLFGLPGKSSTAGQTRLWLDSELTSYVDIQNDDILYSRTLPDDQGTIVWVRANAELGYGSVTSHQAQADFLSGSIATTHLGGAAAGALPGGPPLPPTIGGCPSL